MTDDNSNPVDMDNLDDFENAFYEREPVKEEKPEEVNENEDDALAPEEDEDAEQQDDEPVDEDEDPENDEEEEKPQPKPKGKKSAKERIDEITAEKYELKRQLDALNAKLASRSNEEAKPKETPKPAATSTDAPVPDAKAEDGSPLYPLGEFDPKFIRDLTRFSVTQELNAAEETRKQQERIAQERQFQTELSNSWNEKLEKAEEEFPDIRQDIKGLVEVFSDVEQNYGDYLAAALMGLDNGPAVMRYLSQNIGEAQKIVASGPAAATIAIGRLDARMERAANSEEKRNKRVSTAAEPPEKRTRGQGGKFTTPGDTDDLDAFEREFFKKRKFS